MILDWFNAGEAVLFAKRLSATSTGYFRPPITKGKAIPAKEYQKKFDSLITRIRRFR